MSVDTKRLRDLLAQYVEARERGDVAIFFRAGRKEAIARADAREAAAGMATLLPAMLDELETARALLTEVLPSVDSGAVGHRWTGECDCAACRATALLSPDRAPAASLES